MVVMRVRKSFSNRLLMLITNWVIVWISQFGTSTAAISSRSWAPSSTPVVAATALMFAPFYLDFAFLEKLFGFATSHLCTWRLLIVGHVASSTVEARKRPNVAVTVIRRTHLLPAWPRKWITSSDLAPCLANTVVFLETVRFIKTTLNCQFISVAPSVLFPLLGFLVDPFF